jgi:hypothetical protein
MVEDHGRSFLDVRDLGVVRARRIWKPRHRTRYPRAFVRCTNPSIAS